MPDNSTNKPTGAPRVKDILLFWAANGLIFWLFESVAVVGALGITSETTSQFVAFERWRAVLVLTPGKLLFAGLFLYPVLFLIVGALSGLAIRLTKKESTGWHVGCCSAFIIVFACGAYLRMVGVPPTAFFGKSLAALAIVILALLVLTVMTVMIKGKDILSWPTLDQTTFLSLWLTLVLCLINAGSNSALRKGAAGLLVFALVGVLLQLYLAFRMRNPKREHGMYTAIIFLAVPGLCYMTLSSWWPPEMNLGTLTSKGDKPNILFVVLDTVRADHMSGYGYNRDTSPTVDKLADEGILFENVMSATHWSLASHASMFTGQFPGEHMATSLNRFLGYKYPTMAQLLYKSGYNTAGFSVNPYLTAFTGLDRGLETIVRLENEKRYIVTWNLYLASLMRRFYPAWFKAPILTAGDAVDHTIEWLDNSHDKQRPFFAFINLIDAHRPYIPSDRHSTLGRYLKDDNTLKKALQVNQDHVAYLAGQVKMTREDFRLLEELYDAQIRYMDDELNRLFDHLKAQGLWDNTIILVTADHGEYFGERNLMGHALAVGYASLRVPLVIAHLPGVKPGTREKNLAQTTDFLPTILDAAGVDWVGRNELPGMNLTKLKQNRVGFAEAYRIPFDQSALLKYSEAAARKFDRQTVVIWKDKYEYIWTSNGGKELYYLPDDPSEKNNLVGIMPDLAAEMDFVAEKRARRSSGNPDQQHMDVELSPEEKERLKALGYVW